MRDMVGNVWEKIPENLDFVESSNFIRRSTVATVCICSGGNCKGNRTLTQVLFSCKVVFYQRTSGQLLPKPVSENILKNSCCEYYFNLSC